MELPPFFRRGVKTPGEWLKGWFLRFKNPWVFWGVEGMVFFWGLFCLGEFLIYPSFPPKRKRMGQTYFSTEFSNFSPDDDDDDDDDDVDVRVVCETARGFPPKSIQQIRWGPCGQRWVFSLFNQPQIVEHFQACVWTTPLFLFQVNLHPSIILVGQLGTIDHPWKSSWLLIPQICTALSYGSSLNIGDSGACKTQVSTESFQQKKIHLHPSRRPLRCHRNPLGSPGESFLPRHKGALGSLNQSPRTTAPPTPRLGERDC